jgi:hypothetical protein
VRQAARGGRSCGAGGGAAACSRVRRSGVVKRFAVAPPAAPAGEGKARRPATPVASGARACAQHARRQHARVQTKSRAWRSAPCMQRK